MFKYKHVHYVQNDYLKGIVGREDNLQITDY
jgi:hypothetical protein